MPIKSPSVCVWAGMYRDRVIGPYMFESTVKAKDYLEMLTSFAIPEMKRLRRFSRTVFMHDGAPCHWANTTKSFLNSNFGNRWIGNNGPFHWAPRSPDLTPMDFYFFGVMSKLWFKTNHLQASLISSRRYDKLSPKFHQCILTQLFSRSKKDLTFVYQLMEVILNSCCDSIDGSKSKCLFYDKTLRYSSSI